MLFFKYCVHISYIFRLYLIKDTNKYIWIVITTLLKQIEWWHKTFRQIFFLLKYTTLFILRKKVFVLPHTCHPPPTSPSPIALLR